MTSVQAERTVQPFPGVVPSGGAFPTWPHYDDEQVAAVERVLRSGRVNYWTGDEGRTFEAEYAAAVGTRYAVAVANGTVALELALHALEIPPGAEVIVPSRTFLATASAAVTRGCRPVFADVDPVSGNLSADTIAPLITPRTRAIICVHLAGWPCEMTAINELARRHHLKVIEDCAQSHGAEYRGRQVGRLSDAAAFSFCQDKIITTGGEGGLLTTNDPDVWERAWSYKDHGKGWDTVFRKPHAGVFRWLHDSLGTNWRMTEMQCALGRIQLQRLPAWLEVRRRNAAVLMGELQGHPAVRLCTPPDHVRHSYYKCYAFVRREYLTREWTRDRILQELQAEGIPCGCGSCAEIYLENGFRARGLTPEQDRVVSRSLGETSLMFPVHPTLTEDHMRAMGRATCRVLDRAVAASRSRAA
jgi:hypothetical protein